jgi:hypothetical protein
MRPAAMARWLVATGPSKEREITLSWG